MKKMNKCKSMLIICLLVCIGTTVSCKNNGTKQVESTITATVTATVTEAVQTEIPEVTQTPTSVSEVTEKPKMTEVPQETKKVVVTTVPIYSIDDETLEIEDAVAELQEGQEINAEFIVKEVVKSFTDRGVEIGIYSITEREDGVCVSFEKNKAPVAEVGSSVEVAILDSLAQSLLDNLDTCEKVYFMIEDGPYESGHMAFEEDEPYTWK